MNKLDALNAFCAVYTHESFAMAAKSLGCSTTMVSRYIKNLEDELACLLVKRHTRSVKITEAGEVYYQQIQPLLEQLKAADEVMNRYQAEPVGKLKVSSSIEFGSQYLTPIIQQYRELHANVEIEVRLSNEPVDIWNDDIDLAFRIAPKLPGASFIAQPVCQSTLSLWASEEYLRAHGTPKSLDELNLHSLLFFNHSIRPKQWIFSIDNEIEERIFKWAWSSNNGRILNEAAAQGQGIIQAPSYSVAKYVKNCQLIEVLPEYRITPLQISAVYPHRYEYSLKIKAFVELAKTYFAKKALQ